MGIIVCSYIMGNAGFISSTVSLVVMSFVAVQLAVLADAQQLAVLCLVPGGGGVFDPCSPNS